MSEGSFVLAGKSVVVIGGASGIGFAVAQAAKEAGARVIIASSRSEAVDAAVQRLPGAEGRGVDVLNEQSVAEFFSQLGSFDHLVFTAGDWDRVGPVALGEIDLSRARQSLDVRFWGGLAVAKHASRTITQDGSITMTSGFIAHRPMKGSPMVSVVAGAVEHLIRALAVELAPVRVNAVSPGLALTEHVKQTIPEDVVEAITGPLPLRRAGRPDEVAAAFIYLMRNGYATGEVVSVDGGGKLV